MAEPRDSLLRSAPRGASRNYGMGSNRVQIRQHGGRCPREAAVRPLLHKERFGGAGFADPLSDHQDRPARTGSAVDVTSSTKADFQAGPVRPAKVSSVPSAGHDRSMRRKLS